MHERFQQVAERVSAWAGNMWAFAAALAIVVAWALTGPIFGFSDTWQLVINTGTTIITFLMTFLIQYTQTKQDRALHLKLDELLRAVPEARNTLIDIQHLDEKAIEALYQDMMKRRKRRPRP